MTNCKSDPTPSIKLHCPAERIGIAAIETTAPELELSNQWFGDRFPRKFEKHTGIKRRGVFQDNEVTIGHRTVESLLNRTGCRWSDCAGLVLACPALIPAASAHRFWDHDRVRLQQPNRVARELWSVLSESNRADSDPISSAGTDRGATTHPAIGINGFCSGYALAMQHVLEQLTDERPLADNQYYLVVTATCISRINDYSNPQSGGLFGDYATATMLRRMDCEKLQPRFELCDASYERKQVSRSFFDFEEVENGLCPDPSGEAATFPRRVVFKLDGMGIADTAPRAMASAAENLCGRNRIETADVDWVIPHQAGAGIVRLTGMKLEQSGFRVQPVNDLTANCGNVSSGSVPMALAKYWDRLHGQIACPVAAVGAPGKAEVSQGCILLRGPRVAPALPQPNIRIAG